METDQTQPGVTGEKHPSLAELRAPASHPSVSSHLAACSMCRSIISADDPPIALDLPKGLVSETAFRWPADPIARGGMAQIFAGEDRRLGRTVILKAPRDGDDLPAGMADLFQRRVTAEARVLAKLQHPSIVTIYELGKASVGWPFCVLEKVEGDSLRDRLDELSQLEVDTGKPCTRERLELLSNLVAIAEALAYAHEQRIVHRDCTPNNIILGKRGEATLIDWGIARDLDAPGEHASKLDDQSPSASGRMVTISAGTPPYLPLEQSQGRSAEPSFDVYSFGVTLYEVVSGKTPFVWKHVDGQGRAAQLAQFLVWLKQGEPVAPAMPKDRELSGIIARAMAHDPARRFTADQLVKALKQYLTGDLVFSHRYSVTGRLARWARQHRAATVGIVAVLLFAVAGVLVWLQLARSAQVTAEARAVASAARAEASEKASAADQAMREAVDARAQAEKAEKEGKDAQALRVAAESKQRTAESMRKDAQSAAARSKGDAAEALRVKEDAEKQRDQADAERDAAKLAQQQAEAQRAAAEATTAGAIHDRDAARQARELAERERDAAKQAEVAAQQERDGARAGQSRAEAERDASRSAQTNAERERDAAVASRTTAERERDEARRKLVELEARLRDAERPTGPPPGPPPGP